MAVYFWSGNYSPLSWDNASNWSLTDGGSSAGSYPDDSGDVAIVPASASANIEDSGSFSGTVGVLLVLSSTYGLNFYSPGSIYIDLCIFHGTGSGVKGYTELWSQVSIFSGSSSTNQNYVSGRCYFTGSGSRNESSAASGDAIFGGPSSYNGSSGSVGSGCAIFAGDSNQNNGYVSGDAVFSNTNCTNSGTVTGSLLSLKPITNSGTAAKYPLDVLGAGI